MPSAGPVAYFGAHERSSSDVEANSGFTRRGILVGMGAYCAITGSKAFALPVRKWAAVVIGVNSASGLPVLSAAASGARDMAKWLGDQNYDVTPFVDDAGPVKAGPIFDAIDAIVGSGRYTRLVVYFAGHGFVSQQSEFWLLSKAPHNPNEAISLTASAYLARYSTIANVVFISDACRSRPADLGTANIQGQNIFPSPGPTPAASANVDQFLATHIGDSAYDAPLSDSVRDFHGIYTQALIGAFANPPSNLVQTIDGEPVIPDRDLEQFLLAEVPKRASALNITLRQIPDAIITSPDKTYLGRASGPLPAVAPVPAPPTTVRDIAIRGFEIRGRRPGSEACARRGVRRRKERLLPDARSRRQLGPCPGSFRGAKRFRCDKFWGQNRPLLPRDRRLMSAGPERRGRAWCASTSLGVGLRAFSFSSTTVPGRSSPGSMDSSGRSSSIRAA